MLFNDVVQLWEGSLVGKTTLSQYRGKVKKYLKTNVTMTIDEALSENLLYDFIFSNDGQTAQGKYSALYSIYKFTYEEFLLKDDYAEFPIKLKDVNEFDESVKYETKRGNYETVFLEQDFNLKELLNDKHYGHLNEKKAIITVKAIISMGLSTGLGKGELLKDTNNSNYLKLKDIILTDNNQVEIEVNSKNVKKIILPEDSAQYIIEYINLRKEVSTSNDAFFIKLWNGRDLNFDSSIREKKPSDIMNLTIYILKYISKQLDIPELSINDLRTNKVYHELIHSKGSALNSIIRVHGYVTFVEEVFQRFISQYNNDAYIGFDFFNEASSLLGIDTIHSDKDMDNDEAIQKTYMSMVEKKRRNRRIVEELKNLYQNKCQVCGQFIDMGNDIKYSEVHHIHPIGTPHNGPDNKYNMIVLCPNHHKMFDLGILAIDPVNCKNIIHINPKDTINNVTIEFKHLISDVYIRYHYEHIFINLLNELNRKENFMHKYNNIQK